MYRDFRRRNEQSRGILESPFRAVPQALSLKAALELRPRRMPPIPTADKPKTVRTSDSRGLSPFHLIRSSLPAVIMLVDCDSIATASLSAQFSREKYGGEINNCNCGSLRITRKIQSRAIVRLMFADKEEIPVTRIINFLSISRQYFFHKIVNI